MEKRDRVRVFECEGSRFIEIAGDTDTSIIANRFASVTTSTYTRASPPRVIMDISLGLIVVIENSDAHVYLPTPLSPFVSGVCRR